MPTIVFLSADPQVSLLASALAQHILPPQTKLFSAAQTHGDASPPTVKVLAEWGVDTSSTSLADLSTLAWDTSSLAIHLSPGLTAPSGVSAETWSLPDVTQDETGMRTLRDHLFQRLSALSKNLVPEPALGVIGGSGFYDLPEVTEVEEVTVRTPFGAPSDLLRVGLLRGKRVVFLARHGRNHTLLPSEVNARANLYAMKRLGVTRVVSVSAVGSLREQVSPGDVVLPRQFIDRTLGRPSTFFGNGVVAHVSLADPICNALADALGAAAKPEPGKVHAEGTYLCMEGPQFSTRAESHMYRAWGADIIGMTNATEAKVAREAGICYATLAFPTDYDCWRTATEEAKVEEIIAVLRANVAKGQRIVSGAIEALDAAAPCACHKALETGLMTPREAIAVDARFRLHALLGALDGMLVG